MISIPSDPSETISEGEQAVLDVTYNSINPVSITSVMRLRALTLLIPAT